MKHNLRVRTILFTEVCPLACNYCNLKTQPSFGSAKAYTKEKFFAEVEQAEKDGIDRLHFTGGEPFAYWPWIKEVIEKYGHRFEYGFNTSGYYCNFEVMEFLSRYRCFFALSVDGPREVAMWRRPNNGSLKYDYWDTFEKNIPIILYFFPNTPWKSIINRRLIEFMPQIFMSAMRYGFKVIQFEKDFEEEPWRHANNPEAYANKDWTDEDFQKYRDSMAVISAMQVDALEAGSFPTLTMEQYKYLSWAMNRPANEPFSVEQLNCGIAAERDMSTMYQVEARHSTCIQQILQAKGLSFEECMDEINKAFTGVCVHDEKCPFLPYCARYGCIKDNYESTGSWFALPDATCKKIKAELEQIVMVLKYCQENMPDNEVFHEFCDNLIEGGRWVNANYVSELHN